MPHSICPKVGLNRNVREHIVQMSTMSIRYYKIWHILFHVLGRYHEHLRADRGKFIGIKWNNIERGMICLVLFDKWSLVLSEKHTGDKQKFNVEQNNVTTQQVPYDIKSLMHYTAFAFTKDSTKPTIVPLDPQIKLESLGSSHIPTYFDLLHINFLYCKGMSLLPIP